MELLRQKNRDACRCFTRNLDFLKNCPSVYKLPQIESQLTVGCCGIFIFEEQSNFPISKFSTAL